MHDISLNRDVMVIHKALAAKNRKLFDDNKVFAVNIMGAVGSGKTALIELLCDKMKEVKIGVIAGDVISEVDAKRLRKKKKPVVGINTGKECHLDAHLVDHALEKLPLAGLDFLFIENVGNLICPVDFELGSHLNVVVVSVSEGDDTIEKHPAIFLTADAALINKIDIAKAVDANVDKMVADAKKINPGLQVIPVSIKKDVGVDDFIRWLKDARGKN